MPTRKSPDGDKARQSVSPPTGKNTACPVRSSLAGGTRIDSRYSTVPKQVALSHVAAAARLQDFRYFCPEHRSDSPRLHPMHFNATHRIAPPTVVPTEVATLRLQPSEDIETYCGCGSASGISAKTTDLADHWPRDEDAAYSYMTHQANFSLSPSRDTPTGGRCLVRDSCSYTPLLLRTHL